jgi:hypothetical protein
MKIQKFFAPAITVVIGIFFSFFGLDWFFQSLKDHTGWAMFLFLVGAGLLLNGLLLIFLAVFHFKQKVWAKNILLFILLIEFFSTLSIGIPSNYFFIPYGLIILRALFFIAVLLLIFGKKILKE